MLTKMQWLRATLFLAVNVFTVLPGWANANIYLKVTVLSAPSCTINNNQPIVIDFGKEVMLTRLDGNYYRQPVTYSLVCNKPTSLAMRMLIQGAATKFDSAVLQTSMSDLGVVFFANGIKWPINSMSGFTYPNLPKLEAALIKADGATLQAGEFTAAATLDVFYQ
ncbi:TPA: fimbrial protein [Serratia marcescens]